MNPSLEDIVHAEKQLQQAMVNNDVQALERLLHDDLVFIDVEGNVQGKRDDIESDTAHALKGRRLLLALLREGERMMAQRLN